MTGPTRSSTEIRAYLDREIAALMAQGVARDAAVRVLAATIASTPQKIHAVLAS